MLVMSDFSAGIFTLNENKDKVYPFLIESELFIQYNDKWVGKLSPTDMNTDMEIHPQTVALSKEVPLLHVINAEDHGFYIRILHEGDIKFHFDIPYSAEADLAYEIGTELFGEEWFLDASKAQERIQQASEEAAKRLKERGIPDIYFKNIDEESLKAFQIFGFNDDIVQKVRQVLTIENFNQDSHKMVYDLLDSLGLTQFSFVAHSYASHKDDDRFVVLYP